MKKIFLLVVICLVLLESYQLFTEDTTITSSLAQLIFSNNLHEVRKNELFRSAEMKPAEMAAVVKDRGIKTVLDVRANPNDLSPEYMGEDKAVAEVGATYRSFPMVGSRELPQKSVLELLDIVDKAEPPLLVHCTSGTHRSGLVAAIWLMERDGVSFEEAEKQLSARFGYFYLERKLKSTIQGHPTLDNLLWRYGEYKRKDDISFRTWVEKGMP